MPNPSSAVVVCLALAAARGGSAQIAPPKPQGSGDGPPPCPEVDPGFKTESVEGGAHQDIVWKSDVSFDVVVYWINFEGDEVASMVVPSRETVNGGTFPGHAFRVRTYNDELVLEYKVPRGDGPHTVTIEACGNLDTKEPDLFPPEKDAEFRSLVHDQNAPCVGPSRDWSCIRRLRYEEWEARGTEGYGFLANETTPDRVGLQTDAGYVQQIALVPKVSAFSPGYLKMTMPKAIRDLLLPWYASSRNMIEDHEPIPGGYTNVDKVPMRKLNLDFHQNIRMLIVKEMQQVLQWWTRMRLKHTSTYGIRIYQRGSMLINHVDRVDTHLASAVMQVAQDVDEDGGWPLEIYLGNKTVGEVYLQPGEIVLYEGAWLRHGRPMRFKGNEFANIFTHFSPFDWSGPGRHSPDATQPLPPKFHGYTPWRCDTIADMPGKRSACTVTEEMESVWKAALEAKGGSDHDEL